jgi:hypothetical protein
LLCEEEAGTKPRLKYFVHLPATTSLRAVVALPHQRLAIEQQYQELKSELGLDDLRSAELSRLAASRRLDRRRARVYSARADATAPRTAAHVSRGARHRAEIFTALLFAAKPR